MKLIKVFKVILKVIDKGFFFLKKGLKCPKQLYTFYSSKNGFNWKWKNNL